MRSKELKDVIIPPKIAGIKSTLPDFSLAWQINSSFNSSLELNSDWIKGNKDTSKSFHRHYFCYFEDVELAWHLIQNKGSSGYFFQSKPMFDFLFICNGDDLYNYFERSIDSIKSNLKIDHVFPFDFNLLPNRENYFHNILRTKQFIEDIHV